MTAPAESDRAHRLAQAAQVADLLAVRAGQLLAELRASERFWCRACGGSIQDCEEVRCCPRCDHGAREVQLRSILEGALDAYRSVRPS